MAWINLVEMNMNISRNVYEGKSDHYLVALIQKIATYSIVPLALIAIFEAIVKNLILINLANFTAVLLNRIHDALTVPEKKNEVIEEPPAAVVVQPAAPPTLTTPPPAVQTAPPVIISAAPKKSQETLFDGVSTAAKVGICVMGLYLAGATVYSLYATGCTSFVISNMTIPICPDTWPSRLLAWIR